MESSSVKGEFQLAIGVLMREVMCSHRFSLLVFTIKYIQLATTGALG
jgi:hypothetical protein